MKVECVPTAGQQVPYTLYVVDEALEQLLQSADSASAETVASVEGSGPLTIEPVSVTKGTYYVVVENWGQRVLTVDCRIYQMPN